MCMESAYASGQVNWMSDQSMEVTFEVNKRQSNSCCMVLCATFLTASSIIVSKITYVA